LQAKRKKRGRKLTRRKRGRRGSLGPSIIWWRKELRPPLFKKTDGAHVLWRKERSKRENEKRTR